MRPRLVHGEQGEVMGPGTSANEVRLAVKFPNNKGNVACKLRCGHARRRQPAGSLPFSATSRLAAAAPRRRRSSRLARRAARKGRPRWRVHG